MLSSSEDSLIIMPNCSRCGTNVHPFSFRSFSKITGRCNKCDSETQRAVIHFIDAFREFAADGVLTREEWKQLEELAARENLELTEAMHYASPDIAELVRKGIELATKDSVITQNEEKYFNFLLSILAVPEALANEVQSTINEYKTAQEVRKGNLPIVQSSFDFGLGEVCHLEVPAIYINTDTKTYPKRSGRLWATNSRLLFISAERDFVMPWKKVKTIERDGSTLFIEMAIKKGNGMYLVDRPIIAEAIISWLIGGSEETKIPPKSTQRNQPTSRSASDILDIPANADIETIKLAYRRMAKLYHPDKVASLAPEFRELAELRMKEINAAYQELVR